MTTDGGTTEGTAPEHGRAIAGNGKRKGGVLNGPHREEIIMVASVVGVLLAYFTFKRSSGTPAASSSPQTLTTGSGVLSSGQVAGYDQNAMAGLQTMLANQSDLLRNLVSSSTSSTGAAPSVPTPLAAGLDNPMFTGNYLQYGDGSVQEVEADGSLFHLSLPQFGQVVQRNGGTPATVNVAGGAPTDYSTTSNLLTRVNAANPAPVKAA